MSGDTRQRILEVAADLISESGPVGFEIKGVAERAGISPAKVSYYFKSRDLLIVRACVLLVDRESAIQVEAIERAPTPSQGLANFVERAVDGTLPFGSSIALLMQTIVSRSESLDIWDAQAARQEVLASSSSISAALHSAAAAIVRGEAYRLLDPHEAQNLAAEFPGAMVLVGQMGLMVSGWQMLRSIDVPAEGFGDGFTFGPDSVDALTRGLLMDRVDALVAMAV